MSDAVAGVVAGWRWRGGVVLVGCWEGVEGLLGCVPCVVHGSGRVAGVSRMKLGRSIIPACELAHGQAWGRPLLGCGGVTAHRGYQRNRL